MFFVFFEFFLRFFYVFLCFFVFFVFLIIFSRRRASWIEFDVFARPPGRLKQPKNTRKT